MSDPAPKVRAPDAFSGKRTDLKRFLMQCDVYFKLRDEDFDEEDKKVLFLTSLMKESAAEWIEPYVRDYLDNPTANQRADTRTMFSDYTAARQLVQHMYGDPGENRRAELQIKNLRQGNGTVLEYTASFQRLLAKVSYDDKAAVANFYGGLRESIKDTMSLRAEDRPGTVEELSTLASNIEDRATERALERKGATYAPNRTKQYHHQQRFERKPAWPQPMEIDAAVRGNGSKIPQSEMDRRRREKLCFKCGATGHQSKFHYQKGSSHKQKTGRTRPGKPRQANAANRGGYQDRVEICMVQREENSDYHSGDEGYFDTTELSNEIDDLIERAKKEVDETTDEGRTVLKERMNSFIERVTEEDWDKVQNITREEEEEIMSKCLQAEKEHQQKGPAETLLKTLEHTLDAIINSNPRTEEERQTVMDRVDDCYSHYLENQKEVRIPEEEGWEVISESTDKLETPQEEALDEAATIARGEITRHFGQGPDKGIGESDHPKHETVHWMTCRNIAHCETHQEQEEKFMEAIAAMKKHKWEHLDHPMHAHISYWYCRDRNRCRHHVPETPEYDATKTEHPEHGTLHYTACATDHCLVHMGAKEAGFFPRRAKPVYKPRDQAEINMASKGKAKEAVLEDITEIPETDDESETLQDRESEADSEEEEGTDAENDAENDAYGTMREQQDVRDETEAWAIVGRRRRELESAEELHKMIQKRIAKENGDVSRVKHYQHADLDWKFCREDGCQTHYARKRAERYFPKGKRPVYWVKTVRDPETENIEQIRGEGWQQVLDDQRRIHALNY